MYGEGGGGEEIQCQCISQFRAVKTRFLPGTSLFLPAGDVGGEIKDNMLGMVCRGGRNVLLVAIRRRERYTVLVMCYV